MLGNMLQKKLYELFNETPFGIANDTLIADFDAVCKDHDVNLDQGCEDADMVT